MPVKQNYWHQNWVWLKFTFKFIVFERHLSFVTRIIVLFLSITCYFVPIKLCNLLHISLLSSLLVLLQFYSFYFVPLKTICYLQDQSSRETTLEHKPYIQGSRDVLETAAAQAGIVTVVVGPGTLLTASPSPSLSLSSLSPLSSISSPPSSSRTPQHQAPSTPGKDKNRKKSKTKTQPKTRTIKFHEYKVNILHCNSLSASYVCNKFWVSFVIMLNGFLSWTQIQLSVSF